MSFPSSGKHKMYRNPITVSIQNYSFSSQVTIIVQGLIIDLIHWGRDRDLHSCHLQTSSVFHWYIAIKHLATPTSA